MLAHTVGQTRLQIAARPLTLLPLTFLGNPSLKKLGVAQVDSLIGIGFELQQRQLTDSFHLARENGWVAHRADSADTRIERERDRWVAT